ncbi:MAG TPA: thiol reductant ABC exporter subunit CydC [Demequinaceae bacterium]
MMRGARALLGELEISWRTIALAIAAGSAALGSAVLLGATSAWLIARAAQMPSPADLAIAAVIVRTLGITRGAFRYAERLVSHDAALRGMTNLRARAYERLERRGTARVLSLPRGDIVARTGPDVDAMGDAVSRSIVPAGIAVVVSVLSVVVVGSQDARAGLALAAALAAAAIVPAALTVRSLRVTQERGARADAAATIAALSLVEAGPEHRVWGTTSQAHAALVAADREVERARDAAARPAALAAALQVAFAGLGLVAAVAIGIAAARAGGLDGPAAAVVALTPLGAFEAVSALPAAAAQWFRTRAAAERVFHLVDPSSPVASEPRPGKPRPGDVGAAPSPRAASRNAANHGAAPTLRLTGLRVAWPGATPTPPVSAVIPPGGVLGVIGASGVGKTTLLLTLAGALAPAEGTVTIDGRPVDGGDTGGIVAMTAEDAHVFGTTILENLRVARGDVTAGEAREALSAVGLGPWLAAQAAGLDTELGSGGLTVSGGERRRLLLARVALHPAPIHLIDEGAEHLDPEGADALRALVRRRSAARHSTILVTHDPSLLDVVDTVIDLGPRTEEP